MKNDFVLRNKKDFKNLFKNKTCYYSSFFIIYTTKNTKKHLRTAISVNKKNEKKAVNRNKIKRQVRAIIREVKNKNIPIDMLIIPKKNFLEVDFSNKKQDLLVLIKKISLKSYSNEDLRKVIGKNNG